MITIYSFIINVFIELCNHVRNFASFFYCSSSFLAAILVFSKMRDPLSSSFEQDAGSLDVAHPAQCLPAFRRRFIQPAITLFQWRNCFREIETFFTRLRKVKFYFFAYAAHTQYKRYIVQSRADRFHRLRSLHIAVAGNLAMFLRGEKKIDSDNNWVGIRVKLHSNRLLQHDRVGETIWPLDHISSCILILSPNARIPEKTDKMFRLVEITSRKIVVLLDSTNFRKKKKNKTGRGREKDQRRYFVKYLCDRFDEFPLSRRFISRCFLIALHAVFFIHQFISGAQSVRAPRPPAKCPGYNALWYILYVGRGESERGALGTRTGMRPYVPAILVLLHIEAITRALYGAF